jgi:hypothetical protein
LDGENSPQGEEQPAGFPSRPAQALPGGAGSPGRRRLSRAAKRTAPRVRLAKPTLPKTIRSGEMESHFPNNPARPKSAVARWI